MEENKKGQIPEWPQSVKSWGEKLAKRFDTSDIRLIEALYNSGMLVDAINHAYNNTINIDFDIFWNAYQYKKGNKAQAKSAWEKLSMDKQNWILETALPAYQRYITVTGISKCQPVVWLRGKRYNDEIPEMSRIKLFAKRLEKYMEAIDWEKKFPSYKSSKPTFDAIVSASEKFMYHYPSYTEVEVCGVIKWMSTSWGTEYKHLINPVIAMNIRKFPTYFMHAEKHINKLREGMEERKRKLEEKGLSHEEE